MQNSRHEAIDLAAGFAAGCINSAEARFYSCACAYLRQGGSGKRADEILALARRDAGKPGEGQGIDVEDGHLTSADSRPPSEVSAAGATLHAWKMAQESDEAGHIADAENGHPLIASSSDRDDAGQASNAENGQTSSAPSSRKAPRKPQPVRSAADKAAAIESADRFAKAALLKIDGLDIREWTIGQCISAAGTKRREAYVLGVVGRQLSHLSHTSRVGDVMGDEQLRGVIAQATEYGRDRYAA